jgi:hypothetical protein
MAVLEPDGDPLCPERSCDLILKCGVNSGVVYPRAVVKPARNPCLLGICGNPVGAVVEALARTAELRGHAWRVIDHDAGTPHLHAGLGLASAL